MAEFNNEIGEGRGGVSIRKDDTTYDQFNELFFIKLFS